MAFLMFFWAIFRQIVAVLILSLRNLMRSRQALILENLALRSQLALIEQQYLVGSRPRVRATPAFRLLWMWLSRHWSAWQSALMLVQPETVIRWHRTAFRWYWARKSQPCGRPTVSPSVIALIKRIHQANPLWTPERMHDQLSRIIHEGADHPSSACRQAA